MKNIHQIEWLELLANDTQAVIIDARTPRECAEGIIDNALMIDFLDTVNFKAAAEKLDKNKNYYLYCRSGNRSAQACQLLENLGIEHTYNLSGGMMAWTGKIVVPV